MATNHKTITFIGGDDWLFNIALQDAEGDPINLDNVSEIKFLFHTPFNEQAPWITSLIQKLSPASEGKISIWVPASETTKFESGVYADWLRIVCGGIVSTLLTGPISVIADPWKANVAAQPETAAEFAAFVDYADDDVIVLLNSRERIVREPANDDEVQSWRHAYHAARSGKNLPLPPVAPMSAAWRRRLGAASSSPQANFIGRMSRR